MARVASFLAVRDAARFSVCAKATASAVDVATRRDLRRVHGEATPPRRRGRRGRRLLRLLRRARGQGDDTPVGPRAGTASCLAAWRRVLLTGGDTVSTSTPTLQGAGRSAVARNDIQILLDGVAVAPSDERRRARPSEAPAVAVPPRPSSGPCATRRARARQLGTSPATLVRAFCARVNPSRSVDEIVDAMVVFGPPGLPGLRAKAVGCRSRSETFWIE